MGYKTYTLMTLMAVSNVAFAWQPVIYPIRSQSAYQRSVDSAMCYATANKQTKVNMAHEAQTPPPKPAGTKTSSTGAPSRPPLPPSTFSATPPGTAIPDGMEPAAPTAASAGKPGTATAAAASNAASATPAAPASEAPSATATATANAGHAASATAPASASAAMADKGASEPATTASMPGASQPGMAALPPLPAPEPPMTRYWAAYGACMQARGYVVAQ
ncbi:hypothetical protein [Paraburkholderia graminis]|uniref:Cytoskeletal protein RodZ n=1 Tax=Paraburkholderia graminis TaxID=60548 RepID=A0ABD5C896_9BURK|nr:hypothetical protein [Paraburkholderia graminis]MDR6201452.1 cytoskeletal protein RodZ [Paraburkholderia graminis]